MQRLAVHIETEAAAPDYRKLGVIHDEIYCLLPAVRYALL
jgi:hypothetical protein